MLATTRSFAEAPRADRASTPARTNALSLGPKRMGAVISEGVRAVRAHRVLDLQEADRRRGHPGTTELLRVEAHARKLARREGERAGAAVAARHVHVARKARHVETSAEVEAAVDLHDHLGVTGPLGGPPVGQRAGEELRRPLEAGVAAGDVGRL